MFAQKLTIEYLFIKTLINMKKFILLTIISLTAFTVMEAQAYKWWAGGRTSLWTGNDRTTFSIAPEVGYQFTSKFTVATSIGYHADSYKAGSMTTTNNGIIVNPYIRYTAFKSGILLGFVDGGIEFGLEKFKGAQIGLKPGIAILLTDRFTAATQFGFIGYNDGQDIGGRREGFGFDFSGYCSTIAFFYSF
jgi:hypothetical protein